MEARMDSPALPAMDSPVVVCPAMQSFVHLRVLPLQTSAEEANNSQFTPCFLSLEMGTLRWAHEDNSMQHGNIVSTVFSKEGTNTPGKTKLGRRGSIPAVLSVQVSTSQGTQHIEIMAPQPALSMWHMAIDQHYSCYSALLPAPSEQSPDYFSLTTPMSLLLGSQQHTLTLSMLDNATQIAQNICLDYRLDDQHALAIENALLREQLHLVSPLVAGYRASLAQNHNVSVECELLRARADAAEEHARTLDRLVGEMELVVSQLPPSAFTAPVVQQIHVNTDFTPLVEETKESRGRRRNTGNSPRTPRSPSPSYLAPTASSSNYADMWRTRYEELKGKVEKLEEEKRKAFAPASATTHPLLPPGGVEAVLEENRRLRQVGEGVRAELLLVQQQLRDIQNAANLSVKYMQQQHKSPGSRVDSAESTADRGGEGNRPEQLALGQDELEHVTTETDDRPADAQDWTLHYESLLPPQPQSSQTLVLAAALRGVRWAEVEARLWENIYSHYLHTTPASTSTSTLSSTSTTAAATSSHTPLMSLTTFLKFCKDFHILEKTPSSGTETHPNSVFANTASSASTSIALDEEFRKVSYAELNLLFMSCARIPTSDVPRKPEVFKVSQSVVHVPSAHIPAQSGPLPPQKKKNKSGSTAQSTHSNSLFYLTHRQFLHVLGRVCMGMFRHIVKQVVRTPVENLTAHEQSKILRMASELALVKVFVPMAINLNLLPWSLIHIQDFLHPLHLPPQPAASSSEQSPLLVFLQQRLAFLLGMLRPYIPEGSAATYLLAYQHVSRWARDYMVVPFIINEEQLYSLHKDLCALHIKYPAPPSDAAPFPPVSLPAPLLTPLMDTYLQLYQQQRILSWTYHKLADSGGTGATKSQPVSGNNSQQCLSLELFVVLLGGIAAQLPSTSFPTMQAKVEHFISSLEQRHTGMQQ
eukprot:gene30092-36345_t